MPITVFVSVFKVHPFFFYDLKLFTVISRFSFSKRDFWSPTYLDQTAVKISEAARFYIRHRVPKTTTA
jgi:hypothetical protein